MTTKLLDYRRKQGGVIIFIALIMLVAMSLAGVALMRTVSGGVMLAGNLSLKSTTTRASDFAMETAGEWIDDDDNATMLVATGSAYVQGYSPTMNGPTGFAADTQGQFDPVRQTTAFWDTNGLDLQMPDDLEDFEAKYVIHRMCENGGPIDDNCVTFPGPPQACNVDAVCGTGGGAAGKRVLYRVSIYITGPKNTESFVQVMMY